MKNQFGIYSVLRFLVLVASVALMSVGGGCNSSKTDGDDITLVEPAEGAEYAKGKDKVLGLGGKTTGVWVDCRTAQEYREGHIPGSVSFPYERIHTDHTILKDYDVIVVYGNDYNDSKAEGMSKRLMEKGYKKVYTLRGGLRQWKAEGNEVQTGDGSMAIGR